MISFYFLIDTMGLSRWQSGKEFACQCRRYRFNPWVRKIPWSRKWQPTPVFVPGKFHGHRCLTSCSPWDCEELNTTSDWTQHLILPLEMPGGPPVSETSCLWAVWISFLQVLQFSSVAQSCDPMDCSTPGLPVHQQLLEPTQTHVHPTISSSVISYSSCPQSCPASGSFPVSYFFASGGQSYWSFSISPSNE